MSEENGTENDEPFYKSEHYFDLKDATLDVSCASGVKENASAIAKLAGKSLFNVGLFAGKAGLELIKNSPNLVAKAVENNLKNNGHKMTDEQIEKQAAYVAENKDRKLF